MCSAFHELTNMMNRPNVIKNRSVVKWWRIIELVLDMNLVRIKSTIVIRNHSTLRAHTHLISWGSSGAGVLWPFCCGDFSFSLTHSRTKHSAERIPNWSFKSEMYSCELCVFLLSKYENKMSDVRRWLQGSRFNGI